MILRKRHVKRCFDRLTASCFGFNRTPLKQFLSFINTLRRTLAQRMNCWFIQSKKNNQQQQNTILRSRTLQSHCFEQQCSNSGNRDKVYAELKHTATVLKYVRRKRNVDPSDLVMGVVYNLRIIWDSHLVCDLDLPASLAHLRMEVTSLPLVVLHWARTAAAVTPTVPSLALTPQRKAVAVPALSATCALVLYVCGVAETVTRSQVLTAITCMGLPNVACMGFACYLGCKLLAWWLFLVRILTASSKTMYFILLSSLHIWQRLNASKIMCLSRRQVGVRQNWLFLEFVEWYVVLS